MTFILENLLTVTSLFVAMLGMQFVGRRLGEAHRRLDPSSDKSAYGPTEGAVFALLGLFLAFTFYGAATRFDTRRQLIVQEANAIGTAWLRIDVLPADRQPEVRELFREYVDARLEIYRRVSDGQSPESALKNSVALQKRIWTASEGAAEASGQVAPFTVLLPALNEMIDITTTRTAVTRFHPPLVVYIMIAILALLGSTFVGYGMAGRKVRSLIHTVGFAAILSIVLYVILDLEFPRLGLIRVDSADRILMDVRASMT